MPSGFNMSTWSMYSTYSYPPVRTLRYANMAMEHPPFVGIFLIKILHLPPFMGDFPLPCLITSGYVNMIPCYVRTELRVVSSSQGGELDIAEFANDQPNLAARLSAGPGTLMNIPRTSIPKVLKISGEIHLA